MVLLPTGTARWACRRSGRADRGGGEAGAWFRCATRGSCRRQPGVFDRGGLLSTSVYLG